MSIPRDFLGIDKMRQSVGIFFIAMAESCIALVQVENRHINLIASRNMEYNQ
jgi:hypothetical protein